MACRPWIIGRPLFVDRKPVSATGLDLRRRTTHHCNPGAIFPGRTGRAGGRRQRRDVSSTFQKGEPLRRPQPPARLPRAGTFAVNFLALSLLSAAHLPAIAIRPAGAASSEIAPVSPDSERV